MESATKAKVMLFLVGRAEAPGAALEQALRDGGRLLAERLQSKGVAGGRAKVAVELGAEEISRIWELSEDVEHSGVYQPTEYPVAPYGGALAVSGRPGTIDQLIEAVAGLGDRLGDVADLDRSLAIAGTEETMIPAVDSWVYLNFLNRRQQDTRQAFDDYWRLHHPRFTMKIGGLSGYIQNHPVDDYSRRAAEASGLGQFEVDGVVEAYASGLSGFADQWRWEMANGVPGDELNFTEPERCSLSYYRWHASEALS